MSEVRNNPALNRFDDVEIVAACGLGNENLRMVQQRFGIPFVTEDYRELLGLKGLDGGRADVLGLCGFERGRDEQLRGSVEVFGSVVVELTAGDDLAGHGRPGFVVAQDGAFDLTRLGDGSLDDDFGVVLGGFVDGGLQLGGVVSL